MEAEHCTKCESKTLLLLKWILDCNDIHCGGKKEAAVPTIPSSNEILQIYKDTFGTTNCSKDKCNSPSIQEIFVETCPKSHQGESSIQSCNIRNDAKYSSSNLRSFKSRNEESATNPFIGMCSEFAMENNSHKVSSSEGICCNTACSGKVTRTFEVIDESMTSENHVGAIESLTTILKSESRQDCYREEVDHNNYEEYPRRIRRSKYYDINGDLSHIRRDPKCAKRKDGDRNGAEENESKRMKNQENSSIGSWQKSRQQIPVENCYELENVLIVKELLKYLLNPKSREHQTFALTILKADENLMRIFLEEKKKLGIKTIPVFTTSS